MVSNGSECNSLELIIFVILQSQWLIIFHRVTFHAEASQVHRMQEGQLNCVTEVGSLISECGSLADTFISLV